MAKYGVKHKFTSTIPDGADDSLVQPSDWNDFHEVEEFVTVYTKDPTGWVNPAGITVTYSVTSRTITLTGDLRYMWRGELFELASPWVSDAHANDADFLFFLYSDDGSTFKWSATRWEFDYIHVANARRQSGVGGYQFALREVHGLMPHDCHEEYHELLGTYRISGLSVDPASVQFATSTNAAVSPAFIQGVVKDEDLKTTIAAWVEGSYTTLQVSATGLDQFTTDSVMPYHYTVGGLMNYRDPATGNEVQATTQRYLNVYQIVMPVTADDESQKYRTVLLQPQAQYTSLTLAQGEDFRALNLGNLASIAMEFIAYTRITYQTSAGFANTGKTQIPSAAAIAYLSGTRVSLISVTGVTIQTAAGTPFTPTTDIPESNVQNAIEYVAQNHIVYDSALNKYRIVVDTDGNIGTELI